MTARTILCFGDSLTWGCVPLHPARPAERFPRDVRWTGVLSSRLGDGYHVIEEGLNGRTTSADDPLDPRLNGAAYLPSALASHVPVDLVVIMLGTNDAKAYFRRAPVDIGAGMATLVNQVRGVTGTSYPAPQALVVAPPPLARIDDPWRRMLFEGGGEKTAVLAETYRALTSFLTVPFFDAGSVIRTEGADGIHLTEDNNRDLGDALAPVVRDLVGG